jgi:hypothetical protein
VFFSKFILVAEVLDSAKLFLNILFIIHLCHMHDLQIIIFFSKNILNAKYGNIVSENMLRELQFVIWEDYEFIFL